MRACQMAFWFSCVSILVLSLVPAERLAPSLFDWWDKAQHAIGFVVLSLLGLTSYPSRRVHVLVGLLIFGAAIEIAQSVTGWRYGDPLDWVADAVGVLAGFLALRAGNRTDVRHHK